MKSLQELQILLDGFPQFMRSISAEFLLTIEPWVLENNLQIWNSEGGALGASWPSPLVRTGALKDSLTSPGISLVQDGTRIYWLSEVDYAPHVHARFSIYGVTEQSKERLIELWNAFYAEKLKEYFG